MLAKQHRRVEHCLGERSGNIPENGDGMGTVDRVVENPVTGERLVQRRWSPRSQRSGRGSATARSILATRQAEVDDDSYDFGVGRVATS
jgi:hypothetical protein